MLKLVLETDSESLSNVAQDPGTAQQGWLFELCLDQKPVAYRNFRESESNNHVRRACHSLVPSYISSQCGSVTLTPPAGEVRRLDVGLADVRLEKEESRGA